MAVLSQTMVVATLALVMVLAGLAEQALERRRTGVCPACGRDLRRCRCR